MSSQLYNFSRLINIYLIPIAFVFGNCWEGGAWGMCGQLFVTVSSFLMGYLSFVLGLVFFMLALY